MALNFYKLVRDLCCKRWTLNKKNGMNNLQITPLKCLPPCGSVARAFVNKHEKSNSSRNFESHPNNFPFFELLGWSTLALVGLQYAVLHHRVEWNRKASFKKSKQCPISFLRLFENKLITNVLPSSSNVSNFEIEDDTGICQCADKLEIPDEIIHTTEFSDTDFQQYRRGIESEQERVEEKNPISQESETPFTTPLRNLREAGNLCASAIQNNTALHLLSDKHYEHALNLFKASCLLGSEQACFNAGLCYELGLGAKQDMTNAKEFYQLAAERGHAEAMYNLGVICLQQKQNNNSEEYGLSLVRRAAEKGLYEAHVMLGICLMENSKPIEAIPYLEVASENGHPTAEFYLGVCNENGWGVKKNLNKAAWLYSKAAEKGHADAIYNLGVFHEFELGELYGCKKKAVQLYQEAKDKGHLIAAQRLTDLQNKLQETEEKFHKNISTTASVAPLKLSWGFGTNLPVNNKSFSDNYLNSMFEQSHLFLHASTFSNTNVENLSVVT